MFMFCVDPKGERVGLLIFWFSFLTNTVRDQLRFKKRKKKKRKSQTKSTQYFLAFPEIYSSKSNRFVLEMLLE